jgi:hypothetical protein
MPHFDERTETAHGGPFFCFCFCFVRIDLKDDDFGFKYGFTYLKFEGRVRNDQP